MNTTFSLKKSAKLKNFYINFQAEKKTKSAIYHPLLYDTPPRGEYHTLRRGSWTPFGVMYGGSWENEGERQRKTTRNLDVIVKHQNFRTYKTTESRYTWPLLGFRGHKWNEVGFSHLSGGYLNLTAQRSPMKLNVFKESHCDLSWVGEWCLWIMNFASKSIVLDIVKNIAIFFHTITR